MPLYCSLKFERCSDYIRYKSGQKHTNQTLFTVSASLLCRRFSCYTVFMLYGSLYDLCFLQSLIMVVFREDKHLEDERKAWEFWHSRQHSYKQRVLDIGRWQYFSSSVPVL